MRTQKCVRTWVWMYTVSPEPAPAASLSLFISAMRLALIIPPSASPRSLLPPFLPTSPAPVHLALPPPPAYSYHTRHVEETRRQGMGQTVSDLRAEQIPDPTNIFWVQFKYFSLHPRCRTLSCPSSGAQLGRPPQPSRRPPPASPGGRARGPRPAAVISCPRPS